MVDHDFQTVGSGLAYQGAIIAVRSDEVQMPGGSTATREVVEHYGAVAVAAVDEAGRLAMIRQYRHPVGHRVWELPAGLLDEPGEDPLAAAARELREETGLVAGRWSVLVDLLCSPGVSDEAVRVYLARELSQVDRPAAEHEEADLTVHWLELREAFAQVLGGRIVNACAAAGVLAAHAVIVDGEPARAVDSPWPDRPTALAARRRV